MWHPHPHISSGIDSRRNCMLNISERVVQQHFVVTHVNAGERHAGGSTVKRRSQGISRVGAWKRGSHAAMPPESMTRRRICVRINLA